MPEPIEDRYTDMDEDKLIRLLKVRYGFEIDEVKLLFPTDDEKRDALREFKKVTKKISANEEDKLGWDEEDKQKLTADQQKAIENRVKTKQKAERARKKLAKRMAQENQETEEQTAKSEDQELEDSIKESGNQVTKTEVKKAKKEILDLLSGPDDTDD